MSKSKITKTFYELISQNNLINLENYLSCHDKKITPKHLKSGLIHATKINHFEIAYFLFSKNKTFLDKSIFYNTIAHGKIDFLKLISSSNKELIYDKEELIKNFIYHTIYYDKIDCYDFLTDYFKITTTHTEITNYLNICLTKDYLEMTKYLLTKEKLNIDVLLNIKNPTVHKNNSIMIWAKNYKSSETIKKKLDIILDSKSNNKKYKI